MIKIRQAVIVEGKYDKIKLSSVADALIITTDGFGIFKDAEKKALIQSLAVSRGIIILTDSDSAGFRIRSHIRGFVKQGEIINVYIPDILGKERRKALPSKQGTLGVEGMSPEVLLEALEKAGVTAERSSPKSDPVTKADLLELGLIGKDNSARKRAELQRELGLPSQLSVNLFLEIINVQYSRQEFCGMVQKNKDLF